MGARMSRRASHRRQNQSNAEQVNEHEIETIHNEALMDWTSGAKFEKDSIKYFYWLATVRKLKLTIKGSIERYPFWISTKNYQNRHHLSDEIPKCIELQSERGEECCPRLPTFLLNYVNKTIKFALRFHNHVLGPQNNSACLQEMSVLQKSVTSLYVTISINYVNDPKSVRVRVYERHRSRRTRAMPLFRPMVVQEMLCRKNFGCTFIGNDFLLCLRMSKPSTGCDAPIDGTYIRCLDTSPSHLMTFSCYLKEGPIENMSEPITVSKSEEYASRVLSNKTLKKSYCVKLSKETKDPKLHCYCGSSQTIV